MQLHGEDKKMCTRAAQRNGEVHGAECYVLENGLNVTKADLWNRPYKFKVMYLNGIKIEDNEGNEYTFESEKPAKKNTSNNKNNADEAVV